MLIFVYVCACFMFFYLSCKNHLTYIFLCVNTIAKDFYAFCH